MNKTLLLGPEYLHFLAEMKRRIADARLSAARAVNRELILLYWDLGRAIVEKQTNHGWGESVVEKLAKDLREAFPHTTGFSAFNLWRIGNFTSCMLLLIFWHTLCRKLKKPLVSMRRYQ